MKRRAVEAIGFMDERFEKGFFEDDDYCLRAEDAGFKLILNKEVYVHHFGSQTFKQVGLDIERILEENYTLFREKWGHRAERWKSPVNPQRDRKSSCEANNSSIRVGKPLVSCTLIVRNEEDNIGECLRSVRQCVDEIIVVDTGSRDRTRAIASALGAKVFDSPWEDSFAKARNVAISYAKGDWIFWMDADDRITPENGEKIRRLFSILPRNKILAYSMKVECVATPGNSPTIVDHVRLFPRNPQIQWEYRIHENILPSINRLQGEIVWTDIVIQHYGYLDPRHREVKRRRDHELLLKSLKELPEDPFIHFNIGHSFIDAGQLDQAAFHLRAMPVNEASSRGSTT